MDQVEDWNFVGEAAVAAQPAPVWAGARTAVTQALQVRAVLVRAERAGRRG